jgi:serine/threonine protein kinase
LNHPGVVTLYEFGQAGGLFYFLMEYVDGVSLRHLLEAGRISPREALTIVPQICDALQFAHDLGFVHRDIKPENILMDRRGRVKVADFGVAKLMGAEILAARRGDDRFPEAAGKSPLSAANENAAEGTPSIGDLTGAGKVLGTPQYMAPEQRDNPTEVDHRADIYALGVVFYQLLTGELPGKRLEPPSAKVQIDVRLDDVVLRALERTPQRRYQQASQVKTDVEAIAASPQLTDRGPRADPPPDRTPRMSRTAIAGACWAALFVIPVVELFMLRTLSPSEFGSSPFRWVLSFLDQRLLSLTAPFGTTILGWIAVARIRRSAGRLCGLRLAVFDGLLFPLLAMDALFFWLFWVESNLGILLPLTLLTVIPLNWLIAQRVWRAVKTSSAAGGE